ncbi:MAG: transcriptional repressor NrdR [Clostridia bacterium]|nr:transcriptional repressor NrdR [Clostridia bacterium]
MKCQYCGCLDSKVIDSRPTEEGLSIRRRRECVQCGKRFTTYEKIEAVPLLVVKKDGRREPFDSQKIRASILHACEKRSVSLSEIDAMVSRIERDAYNGMEQEVTTRRIGEMVMEELKSRDQVAYVRFASVYRQFTDISSFMDELTKLIGEQKK